MRKLVVLALAMFGLAACDSNIPGIQEIEDDLRAQLNVSSVNCLTPGDVDTVSVGISVQCVAYNNKGAEISFAGYVFTVGGWSASPDSVGVINIEGIAVGSAPGDLVVRADGTDGTFGEDILTIVP